LILRVFVEFLKGEIENIPLPDSSGDVIISTHPRHGWSLVLSEFVATFGLLLLIWGCSTASRSRAVAVAGYITSDYWFGTRGRRSNSGKLEPTEVQVLRGNEGARAMSVNAVRKPV
jgi:hypothetical protein